jgi:predicted transcriptional regulator
MWELSHFRKRQIVGACLAGASLTIRSTLLGVSRAAVSKVLKTYTNHGKTTSAKRNSGRKTKPSEGFRRTLKRNVSKNHRTTAAKVTAEPTIYLEDLVSTKTFRWELHKSDIHLIAEVAEPLLTENNTKMRKILCGDDKTRTSDDWKYVIWSAE